MKGYLTKLMASKVLNKSEVDIFCNGHYISLLDKLGNILGFFFNVLSGTIEIKSYLETQLLY